MKIGLKFFALSFAALLIGATHDPQLEAWQIVRYASEYVYMIHDGTHQSDTTSDLVRRHANTRITTIMADRRAHAENLIADGYEVWTSDNGKNDMRYLKSSIVVDGKYIIDAKGRVTEDISSAYLLTRRLDDFCNNSAKQQYPKKPSPTKK